MRRVRDQSFPALCHVRTQDNSCRGPEGGPRHPHGNRTPGALISDSSLQTVGHGCLLFKTCRSAVFLLVLEDLTHTQTHRDTDTRTRKRETTGEESIPVGVARRRRPTAVCGDPRAAPAHSADCDVGPRHAESQAC